MSDKPRTAVYIDHSIVTKDACWPSLWMAVSGGKCRLVLSIHNLFEIGASSDRAQQDVRLDFLLGLDPLWVVERRGIQKQEVKSFLWAHKFGIGAEDLVAITSSFSVANYLLSGPDAIISATPKELMRGLDYDFLNPFKKLSPAAQLDLKAADPEELKRIEPEVFMTWVYDSVPLWGPDGKLMSKDARAELATFCYQRREQFFSECPCMAVEDAVTTDRTKDRTTKPKDSDGLDLQHTAVAMSYCDIFFTRDGNQAHSAKVAQRKLPALRLATICRNPEQLDQTVAELE